MNKSPDAFRSIGEVSRLVGVAPHVLRYWEGQFTQLAPVKRADGRRYYRPDDVRLVAGLCQVMREEGLSIRGAKLLIAADRGAGLRDIGDARLGDLAANHPSRQTMTRAVRLARPDRDQSDTFPNQPEPTLIVDETDKAADNDDLAVKPARKRGRAATAVESLPLFPDLNRMPPAEWLARLVAVAVPLRARFVESRPLPAAAVALRDRLVAARG